MTSILWVSFFAVVALNSDLVLAGEIYDGKWAETFSGPQLVKKSVRTDPSGIIVGTPEDQLVLQPAEIRTWSYVYLFKGTKQLSELISIDVRQKKDTGVIFKKICNHYINPVPLGNDCYSFTVVDMGKSYDQSCNASTPPLGPRRVVLEMRGAFMPGHLKRIVDHMVWSNFIAGASANMMVYADFSRSRFGKTIQADIVFPADDGTTDILEMRHAIMRYVGNVEP